MRMRKRRPLLCIIFFLAAALATDSQWEVSDCTELNGYACKGPEGMNIPEIKYGIRGFPKVDHFGIDARIVLEQINSAKKNYL